MTDFLDFALELAAAAEKIILPRFRHVDYHNKADGTPVTEADLKAETVMRDMIAATYPDHGILGEEHGATDPDASHVWVLDPIDGTSAFTLGLPTFGTLVGLLVDGRPMVGVIHMPALGETVFAATGHGCRVRSTSGVEHAASVASPPPSLEEARISTTGVYRTDIDPRSAHSPISMGRLIRACPGFRFTGDCVQYALVATGRLHAALDPEMNPWDIAALVPCILEAGGMVTSASGIADDLVHQPDLLASCGEPLHSEILRLLEPGNTA